MSNITTFNLPPCIKDVVFEKPEPESYEAFLYVCIPTDENVDGKNYGGFHTGYVGDGYWDSSTDDDFAKLCATLKDAFILKIIDFGTTFDMKQKEWELLTKNKIPNKNWYNKWSGYNPVQGLDKDKCRELIKRLKKGDFESKERPVSELVKLERLQGRFKDPDQAQRDIASDVTDKKGSNINSNPILIWKNMTKIKNEVIFKVDNDLVGDGNTTIQGFNRSKHGKKSSLKINLIPFSISKYFTYVELLWIATELNPKSKKVSTPRNNDDASKFVFTARKTNDIPIRSKANKETLVEWQYTNSQVSTILSNAEKMWDEYDANSNGQFCNWKAEPYKSKLDNKVKLKNEKLDTFCTYFSAETPRIDRVLEQLSPLLKRDKKKKLTTDIKKIHIYIYFNSKSIKKKFIKRQIVIEKYLEFIFEQDKKIDVTIEHLPLSEPD